QYDAFDDVVVIHDGAVVAADGLADLAETDLGALCDNSDIFYAKRRTVLGLQERLFDLLDAVEQSHGADIDLLRTRLDKTAAGVDVIGRDLLLDLADTQPVGHELVRVHLNLIFAGGTAKADYIDDIGHRLELLLQNPILEGLQFHQIVFWIGALQRVPVDLPHRAVVRPHLRLQTRGKGNQGQSLKYFLAVPIVVGGIIENEHEAGKSEEGGGTKMSQMRQTVHLNLNRDGDLFFHFLRRATWPLRDDLDVVIGNVGIGFNRQVVKGDRTPDQKQHSNGENDEAVIESKIDDGANHRTVLVRQ